ncbi:hypothetical protein [Streptomyces lydicus]|uniref:hypothetical protein n=1 Tax=Streptomyces lydicus TaxID=47763 RepID=UPI003432865C
MNEDEMARAFEEALRRNDARRAAAWRKAQDREARSCLAGLGCMCLFIVAFVILVTWNPGG